MSQLEAVLKELQELRQEVQELHRLMEEQFLVREAETRFNSKVPLSLQDAAKLCHVQLRWLRERVSRKDIIAYRHGEGTPWKIFPKDIRDYLMENCNQKKRPLKSVLKGTRHASRPGQGR